MKRIISLITAVITVIGILPISITAVEKSIVTDGLFAYYDGTNNTNGKHDKNSTVWKDISGNGHDLDVKLNSGNYWTDNSFHVDSAHYYFASEIVELVNSDSFTVELALGEIECPGSSYISFIISDNDNFSLFLRTDGDFIEFKAKGNSRPKVTDGEFFANNSTVAVTFELDGDICMYVDGECIGIASATENIEANTLFLGHDDSARNWFGDVYSIRFYDRVLSSSEIMTNASADWIKYRGSELSKKASESSGIIMTDIAESNVFTAPAIVTVIEDKSDADVLVNDKPNTAIFKADDNGNTIIGTAAETARFCDNIIPAFEVLTESGVKAVVKNLEKEKIIDYFIVAEDITLLDMAINQSVWSRTVLRVTDKYKTDGAYDLMKIRGDANSAGCHVVILPDEISTRYYTDYLQRRLIGVWVSTPDTEYGAMKGILAGGNGLVTQNISSVKDALVKNFEKNTMTRQILIIGHRGMPSLYPENTVEGSLYAIEAGADIVENDIDITKDGVIIAMHDSTIERTTNGRGAVSSMTFEKLREYVVDTDPKYTDWKVPTLEEYFIEWKKLDKEKQLFIEIKSGNSNLIDEFIRLLTKYDIADQVNVITFSNEQLNRLHAAFPEMSVGHLTSGILNGNTEKNLKTIIKTVQGLKSTFNHDTTGITQMYFNQLNAHGITHWPWTYNDKGTFAKDFLIGINGLTTNYSQWVSDTVKYCFTGEGLETTELILTEGDSLTDVFRTMKYNGVNAAGGKITIVSGDDIISADGNSINALKAGEAYIYATYDTTVTNKTIHATSDLIKVTVQESVSIASDETEAAGVEEADIKYAFVEADFESKQNISEEDKNAALIIIIPAVIIIIIGTIVILKFKKK